MTKGLFFKANALHAIMPLHSNYSLIRKLIAVIAAKNAWKNCVTNKWQTNKNPVTMAIAAI